MPNIIAIGAILASMLTATPAAAPATTVASGPPDGVSIDIIVANGSGCPAGTTSISIAPGNDAFTVTYRTFHAQAGAGAGAVDFRKNCQLNLQIRIPEGWTYAVAQIDHRGRAHLEPGATGIQRSSFYFAGVPATGAVTHQFAGPYDDAWAVTNVVEQAALIYGPCGGERNLNINNEVRVSAGTSDPATNSSITMDSTTSGIYHFRWRQCS
ncbi:DUF4360 domain-containing protein [Actinomycetes bacterium KLBMP 9797]